MDGQLRSPVAPDSEQASLADARPGDVIEITEIFFQMVRNRCWEQGIFEGDVLECLSVKRGGVVLAHPRRGRVIVERACARFVLTSPSSSTRGGLLEESA